MGGFPEAGVAVVAHYPVVLAKDADVAVGDFAIPGASGGDDDVAGTGREYPLKAHIGLQASPQRPGADDDGEVGEHVVYDAGDALSAAYLVPGDVIG